MAHYEDLSPCDYFGAPEGALLAVGWLDPEHPFARGTVPLEVFEALAALVVDAWQPFALAGPHPCGLCAFSGGPSVITVRGVTVPLGALNVFVPSSEGVYVAPSLVLHYLDAHGYAPPARPPYAAVIA